jgi:hypothetical protein
MSASPENRHQSDIVECLLSAKSGLMRRSKIWLFDHFVGAREQCLWQLEA